MHFCSRNTQQNIYTLNFIHVYLDRDNLVTLTLDREKKVSVEPSEPSEPSEHVPALPHSVVFSCGIERFFAATAGLRQPTLPSTQPGGASGWGVGEGSGFCRGWKGCPWQFFVVGVGCDVGTVVLTWSPTVWTEGSSQNQLKGGDVGAAEMNRRSSFTSTSFLTPPISLCRVR